MLGPQLPFSLMEEENFLFPAPRTLLSPPFGNLQPSPYSTSHSPQPLSPSAAPWPLARSLLSVSGAPSTAAASLDTPVFCIVNGRVSYRNHSSTTPSTGVSDSLHCCPSVPSSHYYPHSHSAAEVLSSVAFECLLFPCYASLYPMYEGDHYVSVLFLTNFILQIHSFSSSKLYNFIFLITE